MIAPIALAALNLFPIAEKAISGIVQKNKANQIDTTRPVRTIPGAFLEGEALMRQLAQSPSLPGQALYEANIEKGAAQGVNAIAESGATPGQMISGISAINQNEQSAYNQLNAQAASQRLRDINALYGTLMQKAGYVRQNDQWNKEMKYQENIASKSALVESSNRNIYSAVKGAADVGVEWATGGFKTTPFSKKAGWKTTVVTDVGGNSMPWDKPASNYEVAPPKNIFDLPTGNDQKYDPLYHDTLWANVIGQAMDKTFIG